MRNFLRVAVGVLAMALPMVSAAAMLTGVRVEPGGGGGHERIVLAADAALHVKKSFLLPNPARIVVDILQVQAAGVALPPDYQGKLVKGLRFGQFDPQTSRLVVDLAGPARLVQTLSQGHEIIIEIAPSGPAAPVAPSVAAPASPFAAVPVAAAVAEVKKPLIVIDPGHGGQDPGAMGSAGTREKNITLAMAKDLKTGLLRTGRYRVMLTRETDIYIPLHERVNIARKAKADFFVSLHADSAPHSDARGLSVYTLSDTASDEEAAALAEQENKSDIIAGLDLAAADEDVASILIDLTQRETMNKSARFADMLVNDLHPKIAKLQRTHRFAGFRVLKGPDIPSALIEMGFLSNDGDEQLLASHEYSDLLVNSMIRTLDRYTKE